MAVSHCNSWFQTQSILMFQIHYPRHCGIIVEVDSSGPWYRTLCLRCISAVCTQSTNACFN